VAADVALETVLDAWTAVYEQELDVVHFFDLRHGSSLYRVFLLSSSLELDVSLTPASEFGRHGPTFQMVFGDSTDQPDTPPPGIDQLIGYGWIYALNARAAIARRRLWQAEHCISAIREHGLALACLRHGLPAAHARGVDRLDGQALAPWTRTLVRTLTPAELRRARTTANDAFLGEIAHTRPALAERLRRPLAHGST
jgi:hypothetical protein